MEVGGGRRGCGRRACVATRRDSSRDAGRDATGVIERTAAVDGAQRRHDLRNSDDDLTDGPTAGIEPTATATRERREQAAAAAPRFGRRAATASVRGARTATAGHRGHAGTSPR